jgi:hypothetical protein
VLDHSVPLPSFQQSAETFALVAVMPVASVIVQAKVAVWSVAELTTVEKLVIAAVGLEMAHPCAPPSVRAHA